MRNKKIKKKRKKLKIKKMKKNNHKNFQKDRLSKTRISLKENPFQNRHKNRLINQKKNQQ